MTVTDLAMILLLCFGVIAPLFILFWWRRQP